MQEAHPTPPGRTSSRLATSPRAARPGNLGATLLVLALGACMAPPRMPSQKPPQADVPPVPAPPATTAPLVSSLSVTRTAPAPVATPPLSSPLAGVSIARSAREYRGDAARHLYAQYPTRIHAGTLPPLLHAVGVLNVQIDRQGQVRGIDWMRAPRHAPEVQQEIERLVRAAAPYPVPRQLGTVVYTDTWLWVKGGRFQLDTLTEGQR